MYVQLLDPFDILEHNTLTILIHQAHGLCHHCNNHSRINTSSQRCKWMLWLTDIFTSVSVTHRSLFAAVLFQYNEHTLTGVDVQ